MSKILPAQCATDIVQVDGAPVASAEILSEGKGSSEGVLLLQGDKAYYFTSNATDLKQTIENVITALGQAVTALNQTATALGLIDAKPFGAPGTSAPVAAANIPQITAAATAIEAAKTQLTTLKDILK